MSIENNYTQEELEGYENQCKQYQELLQEVIRRCKEYNVDFETIDDDSEWPLLYLKIDSGRNKYEISVRDIEIARNLLDIHFEKYKFLDGYIAICSYELGTIEVLLESVNYPLDIVYRKLFGKHIPAFGNMNLDDYEVKILQQEGNGNIEVRLGYPSEEFLLFGHDWVQTNRHLLTLKINGLNISTHDQSKGVLEQLANAIFFQLDLQSNVALCLSRTGGGQTSFGLRDNEKINIELTFPKNKYDQEPMTFYWYAKSAKNMPLLQYLAYYQAIEFYFPMYSEMEAKKNLKNILKNPTFNIHNDTDITRLLNVIKFSKHSGYGNEKSQLLFTLRECLNVSNLEKFLENNQDIDNFISSKGQKISNQIVKTSDRSELISQIATRIYDIRCKIVHTKANDMQENVEFLLPFSKESIFLKHDIKLIQFITQEVIISSSQQLNL